MLLKLLSMSVRRQIEPDPNRCHYLTIIKMILKSLQNKKDLNDFTAARFLVFFLLLAAEKKTPKTGQL